MAEQVSDLPPVLHYWRGASSELPTQVTTYASFGSLRQLLGNVKGAVFLTQVHPVPAQADLSTSSWPVGELLR